MSRWIRWIRAHGGTSRFISAMAATASSVVYGSYSPLRPHLMELGALDHQGGVELQHVRTEVGVVEHPSEALQVLLRRRARQPGHEVVADLEAAPLGALVPSITACSPWPRFTARSISSSSIWTPISTRVMPKLHGGGRLLLGHGVRAGLDGHADAAVGGALVLQLRVLQRADEPPVHGVEAALDEVHLVLDRAGGEGAAHDDQVDLVGPVADGLQLLDAALHLLIGVEVVGRAPPGRGLLAGVGLGGP